MKGNSNANSQVLNPTNNFVAVGGNDRIGSTNGNEGGSNRRSGYMQQASAQANNYSQDGANGR